MHAEYCDRSYKWDHDFQKTKAYHILVFGNSYGRDWANILYEYDNNLDISYVYYNEKNLKDRRKRIDNADFVFYAMGPRYGEVPELIKKTIPEEKLYIIGNKNYGESNGIIYAKKNSREYFNQTIIVPSELVNENMREAKNWGNRYIDMMAPVTDADGHIHVFTDDNKFISQDCMHLTVFGAKFYARVLDIGKLLKKTVRWK